MTHALRLAEHRTDAATVLAAEVAAHPLAQVARLADVEHLVAVPAEQVHAGRARQVRRQLELGRLGVTGERAQGDEVVEAEHAEPRRPLDEEVQEVGGGEGVVERAVGRAVVEAQARRQGAQPAVRHLVAHEPAGEGGRVDPRRGDRRVALALECRPQEGEVEADVVADDHPVAQELEE